MIHHFNQHVTADAEMYHTWLYLKCTITCDHICTQFRRSVSASGHGNTSLNKLPRPTRVRSRPTQWNFLLSILTFRESAHFDTQWVVKTKCVIWLKLYTWTNKLRNYLGTFSLQFCSLKLFVWNVCGIINDNHNFSVKTLGSQNYIRLHSYRQIDSELLRLK